MLCQHNHNPVGEVRESSTVVVCHLEPTARQARSLRGPTALSDTIAPNAMIDGKAAMRHPGDDKPNTRSDIEQGVHQQGVFPSAPLVATTVHLRATTTHVRWRYGATTRVFPGNHVSCAGTLGQRQPHLGQEDIYQRQIQVRRRASSALRVLLSNMRLTRRRMRYIPKRHASDESAFPGFSLEVREDDKPPGPGPRQTMREILRRPSSTATTTRCHNALM